MVTSWDDEGPRKNTLLIDERLAKLIITASALENGVITSFLQADPVPIPSLIETAINICTTAANPMVEINKFFEGLVYAGDAAIKFMNYSNQARDMMVPLSDVLPSDVNIYYRNFQETWKYYFWTPSTDPNDPNGVK
jgi:hypothetical protein